MAKEKKLELIPDISKLVSCKFYFGCMTQDEAKNIVVKYKPRSYILTYNIHTTQFEVHFKDPLRPELGTIGTQFLYGDDLSEMLHYIKKHWNHILKYPIKNKRQSVTLLELSRASLMSSGLTYSQIDDLECPESLKIYLKQFSRPINGSGRRNCYNHTQTKVRGTFVCESHLCGRVNRWGKKTW